MRYGIRVDHQRSMNGRTYTAIVVGIILGCISGFLLGNAGYVALLVLIFCGALFPLIVYHIADRTAIWVSMVPNIIMVPMAMVVQGIRPDHNRPFPWLTILLGAVFMAWFSLLISTPVYLFRNRAKKVKRSSRRKDT